MSKFVDMVELEIGKCRVVSIEDKQTKVHVVYEWKCFLHFAWPVFLLLNASTCHYCSVICNIIMLQRERIGCNRCC